MVVPSQSSVTRVLGVNGTVFPSKILIYKTGKDLARTVFHLRVDEGRPLQTVVWNPKTTHFGKSSLGLIDCATLAAIDEAPVGTAETAPYGFLTQSSTILFSSSNVQLKLASHNQFSAQVFSFEMWVDQRMPMRSIKENFEWRRSSGVEVSNVAHSRDAEGWKLVRLRSKFDYTTLKGGPHDENLTSDGYEVVAVWANFPKLNTSKLLSAFKFIGSGASGEMGGLWATMAVLTGLRIAQLEDETKFRQRMKMEVYKQLHRLKPVKTMVEQKMQSVESITTHIVQQAYKKLHRPKQ